MPDPSKRKYVCRARGFVITNKNQDQFASVVVDKYDDENTFVTESLLHAAYFETHDEARTKIVEGSDDKEVKKFLKSASVVRIKMSLNSDEGLR